MLPGERLVMPPHLPLQTLALRLPPLLQPLSALLLPLLRVAQLPPLLHALLCWGRVGAGGLGAGSQRSAASARRRGQSV